MVKQNNSAIDAAIATGSNILNLDGFNLFKIAAHD
jgi:hypothetical protein